MILLNLKGSSTNILAKAPNSPHLLRKQLRVQQKNNKVLLVYEIVIPYTGARSRYVSELLQNVGDGYEV
jgi:hypothetical protein